MSAKDLTPSHAEIAGPMRPGSRSAASRAGHLLLRGGRLTRVAGMVASCAPTVGRTLPALLSSVSVLGIGAMSLVGAGVVPAAAQDCDTSVNCTEERYTTLTINFAGSNFNRSIARHRVFRGLVNTQEPNPSNAPGPGSGGNAIILNNVSPTPLDTGIQFWHAFSDTQPSPESNRIRGAQRGLQVQNAAGRVFVDFSAGGEIFGHSGEAVYIQNQQGGGVINVTFASVTGVGNGSNGIVVDNSGDHVTVSAAGKIEAGGGFGVRVRNGGNDVTGSDININVANVVVTGTAAAVRGNEAAAISAYTASGNGGRIQITAASVTGLQHGIWAHNKGQGVAIAAAGAVTAGTGSGHDGIYAHNAGSGGAVSVTTSKSVTAGRHGIYAKNGEGAAGLSISTSDVVVGRSGSAIRAVSGGLGALTVSAQSDVVGSATGIHAVATGQGDVTVAAAGKVTGSTTFGVRAEGNSAVSVSTTEEVVGKTTGIYAKGSGVPASVRVTAAGHVIGSGDGALDAGIRALNAGGRDIAVSVASVTGAGHGIHAVGSGTGAISIMASGAVTSSGDGAHAIYAHQSNSGEAGGVTVTAANVTADGAAVKAMAAGAGSVSVSVASATSETGAAVMATGSGTGLVSVRATGALSGKFQAVFASSTGGGAVRVETLGTATAKTASASMGAAIWAYSSASESGISITAGGAVTGASHGIVADGRGDGGVSVRAAQMVTGSDGDGIRVEARGEISVTAASVTAKADGIVAAASGSDALRIDATGAVMGAEGYGIHANKTGGAGDVSVIAAAVTGMKGGIRASNSGSGALTVTASGPVVGTGTDSHGVHVSDTASGGRVLVSVASVTGAMDGIRAIGSGSGSALTISASGEVTGTSGYGILVRQSEEGGNVSVIAGDVSGMKNGLRVEDLGAGNVTVSVDAASGGDAHGLHIDNKGGGHLSVTANGAVRGWADNTAGKHGHGIYARNDAQGGDLRVTVGADGDVTGSGTFASEDPLNADLRFGANGIQAIQEGSGAFVIDVAGSVAGARGAAIRADNRVAGRVDISVSGSVTGGSALGQSEIFGRAARSEAHAIFVKDTSSATGLSISVGSGGSVTARGRETVNQGTATPDFGRDAIHVDSRMQRGAVSISVARGAQVDGEGRGIYVRTSGSSTSPISISVAGSVTGRDATGNVRFDPTRGAVERLGRSEGAGVHAEVGPSSQGITMDVSGSVTGQGSGIYAVNSGRGRLSITASGQVESKGTHAKHAGIYAVTAQLHDSDIEISATGTVTGARNGIYARSYSPDGRVTVTAKNVYAKTHAGILVKTENAGSGPVGITVSGTVEGGNAKDPMSAAIVTQTSGDMATIVLASGAHVTAYRETNRADRTVGSGTAISDLGDGKATLVVEPGARIDGAVKLGGGDDTLILRGGDFRSATGFDGGAGKDTLRIDGRIEHVIEYDDESGDGKPLNLTLLQARDLTGWEEMVIESGGEITIRSGEIQGARRDQVLSMDKFILRPGGALSMRGGKVSGTGPSEAFPDDKVTIDGDFVGGGRVLVDANLSTVKSDTLVITGSVSGGQTVIEVNDVTGEDVAHPEKFPVLVSVATGHIEPNAFVIGEPVVAGAFVRGVVHGKATAQERREGHGDDVFRLQKVPGVSDSGALLEAIPRVLAGTFNKASSLAMRNLTRQAWPQRDAAGLSGDRRIQLGGDLWLRSHAHWMDYGESANGGKAESNGFGFQMGLDLAAAEGASGNWIFGFSGQYAEVQADVTGVGGTGALSSTGYGAGATVTWYGDNFTYADLQTQMNWIESDLSSTSNHVFAEDNGSSAWFASLEVGKHLDLSIERSIAIVPQAQFTWGNVRGGESFRTSSYNPDLPPGADQDAIDRNSRMEVHFEDSKTMLGRIGVALEFLRPDFRAYTIANILHDFSGERRVSVDGQDLVDDQNVTSAEIGFGTFDVVGDNATIFFEGSYRMPITFIEDPGDNGFSMSLGAQWNW